MRFPPTRRERDDRRGGVAHYFGNRDRTNMAVILRLPLDPAPNIEIARHIFARPILCRELRNLYEPGLDRLEQAEVGHYPRERLAHFVAAALDIKWRR